MNGLTPKQKGMVVKCMDREILFRGKCIDETCLKGKWLEGDRLHDGVTGKYYIHRDNCLNESDKAGEEGLLRFIAYEVDPETVCRYTGSLTVDIKKIFTNDIVEIDGVIGVVKLGKYGNGFHLGFYIEWINSEYRQELGFWEGKVKHRGNVFDNTELING